MPFSSPKRSASRAPDPRGSGSRFGPQRLAQFATRRPRRVLAVWGLVVLVSLGLTGTLLGSGLTSDSSLTNHPESATKVSVDEGGADLPARVRSGELHMAIGFQDGSQPRDEPPGLERRDLLQEQFMVALASDHRLAQRPQVRLADLSDDDWTVASTNGLIVRACQAAGFTPNLVSITHDQLAIRALISQGLAVTLAPQLLADAFKDLTLRPIAGPSPARDVYTLLPPGNRHPLVAPTLDALTATAADLQRRRDGDG
jgi:DNA-binding transcriptional LysR family regulator